MFAADAHVVKAGRSRVAVGGQGRGRARCSPAAAAAAACRKYYFLYDHRLSRTHGPSKHTSSAPIIMMMMLLMTLVGAGAARALT